ncbi:hypothetical protein OUZ56_020528 [Daphnia magna]|uniref:Uncharacterized protein n=1 Tax=Daphnia magna TaxID=35525 RepID=A0ABQ9ZEQ3_9CRUS|nr:hypothetical protein OUZ56_020528 [Daphnia magna]
MLHEQDDCFSYSKTGHFIDIPQSPLQRQIKSVVPHIITVTPTKNGKAVNDAEIRRDLASIYKDTREVGRS